jgi:hypothetical protein
MVGGEGGARPSDSVRISIGHDDDGMWSAER